MKFLQRILSVTVTCCIVLSCLGACAPEEPSAPTPALSPVPSATASPSPTPTPGITVTVPPQPTPTPAPEPADASVLTRSQRDHLAAEAQKFIANTQSEAIEVARGLKYLDDDGFPSSVCGPLSAAILRDAGLLEASINLHRFWYLNPRPEFDQAWMEEVFPRDRYLWYQTDTSVRDFDWKAFPLLPGDMIYTFAGKSGSFEHIMTIDRVDAQGRAYAVTNLRTDEKEGFIIQEVMLYDPNEPGTGMFYDWTDWKLARVGMTGSGGFMLWRPQVPISEKTAEQVDLEQKIDALLPTLGGKWNILVQEAGGAPLYTRRVNELIHPASTLKVPLAMLFFRAVEKENPAWDRAWLAREGSEGRSFEQLLHAMLVESEEEATETLFKWTRARIDIRAILDEWGAPHINFNPRTITVWELAKLLNGLSSGTLVSPNARTLILEYMETYTPNDDTRIGVLRPLLSAGDHLYNKRGSLVAERLIVADTAILEHNGQTWLLLFFGYPQKEANDEMTQYETLDAAIQSLAQEFWQVLQ